MDLYLVRHAIAEPRDAERWPDDSQRPLSPNGIELFRLAARGLRRIGVEVEVALASSYVRAWHTAEILSEDTGWPAAEPCAALEPPNPASACVDVLRGRRESSLALVGHQPQLSELASLLLASSESELRFELKKGGVICLRFSQGPAAGEGTLRWSVSPKILRQIDR